MTDTHDPLAPTIEQFSPDEDEQPRSPRSMLPEDWAMMAASAAAAVSLMWVVLYRLLPIEGPVGFWFLSWVLFLALYGLVVRTTSGRLVATDRVVAAALSSSAIALLTVLVAILGYVVVKGLPGISAAFFTQTMESVGPLDPPDKGGALHAILGTLMQLTMTVIISVPLGITTAVFLNEVGGRWARPVRTLVDAMSGVPSIVAGLFIFTSVILTLGWGFSGFAAALALSVLMLPTVTRTTEEVLRLVPGGLREAALALGAPRWRVVLQVVLPTSRSGVVTAVILGMARAVGETAPLLLTAFGAQVINNNPFSGAQAALPLSIFQLARNSDPGQVERGWAQSLVLIFIVLVLFSFARLLGRSKVAAAVGAAAPGASTASDLAALDPAFDLADRHGEGFDQGLAPPPDLDLDADLDPRFDLDEPPEDTP